MDPNATTAAAVDNTSGSLPIGSTPSVTATINGDISSIFQKMARKKKTNTNVDAWTHANKVCRHTILSTLSNDLFDVYCSYKEAKEIWNSMIAKYTDEDVGKQKFMVGNLDRWRMEDNKDIKVQINEYHKLNEDLKILTARNSKLPKREKWQQGRIWYKLKTKIKGMPTYPIIQIALFTSLKLITLLPLRKKGSCFFCGKPDHHAPQYRKRVRNDNPPKPNANSVEGDDIITAVISQAYLVANVKEWVVDSGATRHICANKDVFSSYKPVGDGEEHVYLGDSQTVQVFGKGKVVLKLTFGKTLALNDVLHVPNIRANLISATLLGKVGVKVSFESGKIEMTKNNIFVGKGYCNQGLSY
ncbi:uncharacterized protein LOC133033727 [Cannabis sativa]|uniref:uncharacterized protein LOC133033727 n=1 Tax=Cannabis sativa TaxID=3483 RepID=UPI0029CA5E45|nr:uncharacterized protein LOC133033727 [Cannabis sativa]